MDFGGLGEAGGPVVAGAAAVFGDEEVFWVEEGLVFGGLDGVYDYGAVLELLWVLNLASQMA